MDQLKDKINSYVLLVHSIEELLKYPSKSHTDLIKSQFKSIVKLEIDIITSLEEINKDINETKQRKLLLNRLRDCYNEAHDKYELLHIDYTVSLQQNHQNTYYPEVAKQTENEETTNDSQTGLLRKLDISVDQEFDLEKIRKQHNEVKKIEEAIDSSNHIYKTLSRLTHEQGETIDNIENNIDTALLNINQGNDHLKKAKEYHIAAMKKILPFAGAAVAAGVTGPVGLIYGFKIGMTAALAISGITGYVGTKMITNKVVLKHQKAIANESHSS